MSSGNAGGAAGQIFGGIGQRQEASGRNKQEQTTINRALGELTPQAISALMSKFFPQYFNQIAPQMQTAMGGMAAQAARHGLTGTGAYQQLSAGLPGQFSNYALQEAIKSALGVSSERSRVQRSRKTAEPASPWTIGGNAITSYYGGTPQPYDTSMQG